MWLQVKDSSLPAASSVAPDGEMPSQPVSLRAANLSVTLPVFLTTILYSTVWPICRSVAGGVAGFAFDPLELFDREDGSAGTLAVTLLEVLVPVPSLPSIEASLV